jgi:transposase InsO family protein
MAVITDHLGKGIIIKPMKIINAEATTHMFIKTFYHCYSLPSIIVSDQGSAFVGALWLWVCYLLKITHWLLTTYYPETDGAIKQINTEVEAYLHMFVDRL